MYRKLIMWSLYKMYSEPSNVTHKIGMCLCVRFVHPDEQLPASLVPHI